MGSLRRMSTLAAAAVLTGSAPAGALQSPVELDVMTFNIRTSMGRDGANAWPHRKHVVAAAITQASPDVVGLQEALDDQIEYLAAELPEYRWLGVDRGLNGGTGLSEYTPIFYRHAVLSPIESGTFWLSGSGDVPEVGRRGRRGGRIVTWARFHHRETGRQVYAFNTHFTLRRGQRQIESMERIGLRVSALPEGSVVLLTGDFNAVAEHDEPWRMAMELGLRDAWIEAGERRGPAVTANGFGPPPPGREGRIDWILVGGPVDVRSVETLVYEEDGRYASDHYPVVARLTLRP